MFTIYIHKCFYYEKIVLTEIESMMIFFVGSSNVLVKSDTNKFKLDGLYEKHSIFVASYKDDETRIEKKIKKIASRIRPYLNSNEAKYIILHIVLALTGSINVEGNLKCYRYKSCNRNFLITYLLSLYEKEYAKVLLRVFEKRIKCKSPLKSKLSKEFKGKNNSIDFAKFVNAMSENFSDFEDFITNLQINSGMCNMDCEKYNDSMLLHHKELLLKNSYKILSGHETELKSEFELVSPNCDKGKHIIIAVSGFLSEKDDNLDAWKGLVESYYRSFKISDEEYIKLISAPVYSYRGSHFELFVLGAGNVAYEYAKMFRKCMDIAALSGKLLAHSLMIQFPFKTQSISLIGFSLGTHVIYNCLKELNRYKENNIIHNVYFLGGATSAGNKEEWRSSLSVVRGRIINAYCSKDYILTYLFRISTFKHPIGLYPLKLNEDLKKNKDKDIKKKNENTLRITNCDVTKEANGHLYYRSNMHQVIEAIDFYE